MSEAVRLPKLGLTMEEATLVKWHKDVGEKVEKDDVLFEVETDKSTLEVEAPISGYVLERLYEEGDVVPVSEIICYIGEQGAEVKKEPPSAPTPHETKEADPVPPSPFRREAAPQEARIFLSPAARRKARELGLSEEDLRQIKGSGPRNRIVLKDLQQYSKQQSDVALPRQEGKNVVPLSRIRRITAERLTASFRDIPQFTIKKRIDLTNIMHVRETLKSVGVHLSINDFLIQASAQALKKHKEINSYFSNKNNEMVLIENEDVNIGLAVALDDGLIVPVIKQADQLSLAEIAKKRVELVEKAKTNELTSEEMTGGTFTISNLGSFDVDEFTAIINPPETAILAVGSVIKQAVVNEADEIEIKPILTLTASFDHRAVDGADAAKFMKALSDQLESAEWNIV